MKKKIIYATLSLAFFSLYSCSDESQSMKQSNQSTLKTQSIVDSKNELADFRAALREINLPENQPTPEEKALIGSELSSSNKQRLLPAAKKLIYSTGVTEAQLNEETNNDIDQIIHKGLKLYVNLTSNN